MACLLQINQNLEYSCCTFKFSEIFVVLKQSFVLYFYEMVIRNSECFIQLPETCVSHKEGDVNAFASLFSEPPVASFEIQCASVVEIFRYKSVPVINCC